MQCNTLRSLAHCCVLISLATLCVPRLQLQLRRPAVPGGLIFASVKAEGDQLSPHPAL